MQIIIKICMQFVDKGFVSKKVQNTQKTNNIAMRHVLLRKNCSVLLQTLYTLQNNPDDSEKVQFNVFNATFVNVLRNFHFLKTENV